MGFLIVYGFNTLVLWSTTQIGFTKSAIIGLIQPILILAMLVLLLFLWSDPSVFTTPLIINIVIKILIAFLIFIIAILDEYTKLSEKEKIEIKSLKRGESLMFIGDNHILANIEAAEFEKEIIKEGKK